MLVVGLARVQWQTNSGVPFVGLAGPMMLRGREVSAPSRGLAEWVVPGLLDQMMDLVRLCRMDLIVGLEVAASWPGRAAEVGTAGTVDLVDAAVAETVDSFAGTAVAGQDTVVSAAVVAADIDIAEAETAAVAVPREAVVST